MSEVDLVLALEETGRAGLPEPVVESAAVAGPLLAEVAGPAVKEQWLPAIASGTAVAVIQSGGISKLIDADAADLLVLIRADEIHIMRPDAVRLEPQTSVDGSRRLFLVDWHRSRETLVESGHSGWEAINVGFDRGALGTAAQLVGLADRMIAMTVDHVSERKQFGAPIGSFQAVKHQLADAYQALEFARPVVYRAAYSMAHRSPSVARDVSMAKVFAGEAAHRAGRVALQCHGAVGYTTEYDLHLFMKRGWVFESTWGQTRWHRERVATSVLGLSGRMPSAHGGGHVEPSLLGETIG